MGGSPVLDAASQAFARRDLRGKSASGRTMKLASQVVLLAHSPSESFLLLVVSVAS
jgi:hypothetical protein